MENEKPAIREDGYVNILNNYGTEKDSSTQYQYQGEATVMDTKLNELYETNGLFAKIIDTPAEEAFKHGFELNLNNDDDDKFVRDELDRLNWEEIGMDAIRWTRLFGGAIIVMLIDDGRTLEEPLDYNNIRSIEEIRVYERSIVQPDYTSLYHFDPDDPARSTTTKYGMPEYYYVYSVFGQFIVHESRCLVFKNGNLPERVINAIYRFWGIPEYLRIKDQLREVVTAHHNGVQLLERANQGVFSMKNLANILQAEDGDEKVLERLRLVDKARHFLNTMLIDADGESYEFKTMTLTGAEELIDKADEILSALTSIPQTILFGRSPAGENATGESDFENFYNLVEGRIQRRMIRRNQKTLIDIISQAGVKQGKLQNRPAYNLKYNPLWSQDENEAAQTQLAKAQAGFQKAQTANLYVEMQALDSQEVRASLKKDEEFEVETILDEESPDVPESWAEQAGIQEPSPVNSNSGQPVQNVPLKPIGRQTQPNQTPTDNFSQTRSYSADSRNSRYDSSLPARIRDKWAEKLKFLRRKNE